MLIASKWENGGKNAARARRGYHLGWGYVLNVWAGRRTAGIRVLDGIGTIVGFVRGLRPGGAAADIAKAGGEISGAS